MEGSDSVFRDLGDPDADLKHAKAVLAAHIIEANWEMRTQRSEGR